jgi:hypothetical protein
MDAATIVESRGTDIVTFDDGRRTYSASE